MGVIRWLRRDEVPSRNLRLTGLVVVVAVTLLPVPARAADPPVNLVAPTVEGTPTFRERLTAAPGGWTPAEGLTYAYQWLRDGAPVAEATTASYRLDLDDLGHTLAVSVTATDAAGAQVAAASAPTTPVAKAVFEVLDKPVVTGVPRFTRTLTADKPRLKPRPTSVRFRWLRDDEPVRGARGRTHRVGVDDVGHRLRLQVTVRREGYATEQLLSRPREALHLVPVRRSVTYHVETRGPVTADLREFRRQAQETFDDPRGWRGGGCRGPARRARRRLHARAGRRGRGAGVLLGVQLDVELSGGPLRGHQPGPLAQRLAGLERRGQGAARLPAHGRQPRDRPLAGPRPSRLPGARAGSGDDAAVEGARGLLVQPLAAPVRAVVPPLSRC